MVKSKQNQLGTTKQKHLIVLHVLIDLGGAASKKETLDYIEVHKLYRFKPNDHDPVANRNGEPKWRINFAYRRKDLADKGFIDDSKRNRWAITNDGRQHYQGLLAKALTEHKVGIESDILTEAFWEKLLAAGLQEADSGGGAGLDVETRSVRATWSHKETEWHHQTCLTIASTPAIVQVNSDLVVRTWSNSLVSDDNKRLWRHLLTQKRPDVVFELTDGTIVPVEVEPCKTLLDGIAQLAGDYVVSFQVDCKSDGSNKPIMPILVTDADPDEIASLLIKEYGLRLFVRKPLAC